MGNSVLLESDIVFEVLIAGSSIFGALISALSVYYFGIAKRDRQNADSLLSRLDSDFPLVLNSLISLSMQYQVYEKTIRELQQSHTHFTPFEFNPFEYLKENWNLPHNAFTHDKELAKHLHAFARNLATLSLFAQRTHKRIDSINQKYDNHRIDAQQAIKLYEQTLKKDQLIIADLKQTMGHGFFLWAKIRNKNEDPQDLYKQLHANILNTARQMYNEMFD